MLLTLTNDFHSTEARVRIDGLPAVISASQMARARKKLCGLSDCTCGGVRGIQEYDGFRLEVEPYGADAYRISVDWLSDEELGRAVAVGYVQR